MPVQELSLLPIAMPVTTVTQMNNLAPNGESPTQPTWGEVNGRSGRMTWVSWAQQRGLEALGDDVRSNAWLWTHP